MSNNKYLDLNSLRYELGESYIDYVDTSNPFENCHICEGDGEIFCEHCSDGEILSLNLNTDELENIECPDCGGSGYVTCPNCKDNDREYFEIMWDTAFNVPYLRDGLDFQQAKEIAWRENWLLLKYDNEYWLAAGSCGYDFTWDRAAVMLKLCGSLPYYIAEDLRSGGHVFVSAEQRTMIASAAVEAIQNRVKSLQYHLEDLQRFLYTESFLIRPSISDPDQYEILGKGTDDIDPAIGEVGLFSDFWSAFNATVSIAAKRKQTSIEITWEKLSK